jgi:type II secretory pathway component PulJ
MGSSSMMDIIGSFVIAGFLFLMTMRLNQSAQETSAAYHIQLNLQTNLTTMVSILEYDLRKIGYCRDFKKIPDPTKSLLLADSTRIKFLCDYNNDGNLDSIYYWLGDPSELTDTPNPRDRFLYKQTNNLTPEKWNFGVTTFRLKYYDALGDSVNFPIADPSIVYSMEISVQVQAADPYDQVYVNDPFAYETFWRQIRLVSRNLQNR